MKTLLVANRGEIAVRIMQTAHRLGLTCVGISPEDDRDCLHVRRAASSKLLPGVGAAAYLDVGEVVAAAVEAGADALHPGYGFLSENRELAQRCRDAGITFVGPDPDALALFGSKTASRERAAELDVPVLAGTTGATSLPEARAFLAGLGPDGAVMVKAVAGGGGRGMRPVRTADELDEAYDRCASEALAAFGDGDLYVEQLLTRARHVEVQVIGDGTGAVTTLADRDCSVQRRRQKLVEIAPAPGLSDEVRNRLRRAAVALTASACYRGLATVEFLVQDELVAFLEVNPRIQVEHTVTEQVLGVDLVELGLRVADGETLEDLGVGEGELPEPTAVAIQLRVNAEELTPRGDVRPSVGELTRFVLPGGPGVRVDTLGYPGYRIGPRYDSLLAKVVVTEQSGSLDRAVTACQLALAELEVEGVVTNRDLLRAILQDAPLVEGGATTAYVDEHLTGLLETASLLDPSDRPAASVEQDSSVAQVHVPQGAVPVTSPMTGVVVEVPAALDDLVSAGATVLVVEAMKMEHVVTAPEAGRVLELALRPGDVVHQGAVVAALVPVHADGGPDAMTVAIDPDDIRPDLAEVLERRLRGRDEGRPAAVAKRRSTGQRTARENLTALFDDGAAFTEYGAMLLAAQRRRRSHEELVERTPADGLVSGFGAVHGQPVLGMAYDASVLGGTQGLNGHRKMNRLLEVAERFRTPIVVFAEGGGGRPGDTEMAYLVGVEEPTFTMFARMSGMVPRVAVVSGRCFAGNAALAGLADVIVATEGANLGMAGKPMIEGALLGQVETDAIGPMTTQTENGVVDLLVADEEEAARAVRQYLSYFQGPRAEWECADQRLLRQAVPENRMRAYDVRRVIELLADTGSVLELRPTFGAGILTALVRIEGRPMGLIANNAHHLGGAIDGPAADKAGRFLQLCDAFGLPVLSLCDTPGFMVGVESEETAAVRRFSRMMTIGANAEVPIIMIIARKAYGLGAMAMAGGDVKVPIATFSWPTGELGGMGLEGYVRLAHRAELASYDDEEAREARYRELLAELYEAGKALSVAGVSEIDDVIDPMETRAVISGALAVAAAAPTGRRERAALVEPW